MTAPAVPVHGATSTTAHPAIVAALKGFEPTDEQWQAIRYPPVPLSVVAGAGSGKTAVMAARIAHLVVSGQASPAEILGLTFTNKAAKELEARVDEALARVDLPPGEEASVFTYHGFADRVVRDYGPRIGIEPEVALLSKAQAYMLIERLLEDMSFDALRVNWIPTVVGKVGALAEACGNHLVDPERVIAADAELAAAYERAGKQPPRRLDETLRERPDVCRAVRAYIDRKRALGRIDYGDQIQLAFRLVAEHPEVAAALGVRWPVVLLDEYQDTNVAQRKMIGRIYAPGSAITVVGDPDQAIYAWRGATLHNILAFPRHFPGEDGVPSARRPLQVSFRSARRILAVADAVISEIPAERRGGQKVLLHHAPTGEGRVTCDLVASQVEEAELVATEIERLTDPGEGGVDGAPVAFEQIAILCRARRLFAELQSALRRRGIPVEVVGLQGLLTVPEVTDLLAHLRLAVDPGDNISFARIAMGPRWRVGFRDLAALARWAAQHTRRFVEALAEKEERWGEVDPGEERFSLSEALGRIAEVPDLSEEARSRLARFGAHLDELRAGLRGATLSEAVERVLTASGIEDELRAAGTPVAEAARANLSSFLDETEAFSPLEGEASVPAFLDYLDSAKDVADLEIAQPQLDHSVKLMTMHQAKGLEFDVVFVPGMAKGTFPEGRVTDNPTMSSSELPYSVREDAEHLPQWQENMSRFHEELRARHLEDERRLAYVALTRARKELHLSAAHWYGRDRKTPAGPGIFFAELAGAPAGSNGSEGSSAHDAVEVRSYVECPPHNPVQLDLENRAQRWPPAEELGRDPLFAEGWRVALERALADPESMDRLVATSGVDPERFAAAKETAATQLELVTSEAAPPSPDERLKSLSVSSVIQLARCPKQFYWTVVRPLPRRPSAAARTGQEIHRWIQIRSIGQGRLDDPEAPPDLAPDELGDEDVAGGLGSLRSAFESSRYARMRPRFVEQPFVLALGEGYLVRGRMDAVYVTDDGMWEVVDYKTGGKPSETDTTHRLQLTIYALAAQRIWGIAPESLRVSCFYLRSGVIDTTAARDLDFTTEDLVGMFATLQTEDFSPTPSDICRYCDFLRFCDAGRSFVAAGAAGAPD